MEKVGEVPGHLYSDLAVLAARRTGGYQWLCQEDWGVSMAVPGGLGGYQWLCQEDWGVSMAVLSVKQPHTSKTPRASENNQLFGRLSLAQSEPFSMRKFEVYTI